MRAMREGVRPDGANYFPAFPYSSFTRIADADLRDLWAYLRTLAPNVDAVQAARAALSLRLPLSRSIRGSGFSLGRVR